MEKPRSDQTDTKFSILGEYQNGKDIGVLKLNWNRESISIACWFDWFWLDWMGFVPSVSKWCCFCCVHIMHMHALMFK